MITQPDPRHPLGGVDLRPGERVATDRPEFKNLLTGPGPLQGSPAPSSVSVQAAPPLPDALSLLLKSMTEQRDSLPSPLQKALDSLTTQAEETRKLRQEASKSKQEAVRPALTILEDVARTHATEPLKAPALTEIPAPPPVQTRPFLSSDGKNALQSIVGSLSVIVTAWGGLGSPLAALQALTGAMDGFHEGDLQRTQKDFNAYQAKVQTIKANNERAVTLAEHARTQRADDMEAAKAFYMASLAKAGLKEEAAQVAQRGLENARNLFDVTARSMTLLQSQDNRRAELAFKVADLQQRIADQSRQAGFRDRQLQIERERIESTNEFRRSQEALRHEIFKANQAIQQARIKQGDQRLQLQRESPFRQLAGIQVGITKQLETVDQGIQGAQDRLTRIDRVKDAVDLLDQEGLLPKGPTVMDEAKAQLNRRVFSAGRTDLANAINILNREGTPLVVGKEIELQGGRVAALRFAAIANAEAGNLIDAPKSFWDGYLPLLREVFDQKQRRLANARQELLKTLRAINPSVPPAIVEQPVMPEFEFQP